MLVSKNMKALIMRRNHKKHIRESLCRSVFDFLSNSAGRNFIYNYLACEFTARYVCRNEEMNHLKSTTTNGLNFRIIN